MTKASNVNPKHLLILGVFNFPNIDWDLCKAWSSNSHEQKFINCLQDKRQDRNFQYGIHFLNVWWMQGIATPSTIFWASNGITRSSQPTRWRGDEIPSPLDLIITKDEEVVSKGEPLNNYPDYEDCLKAGFTKWAHPKFHVITHICI